MSGERILIVEDEPVDAHGLEYRLTTEGFQVDLVETGKAALEFVKDNPPRLILLDLRLPDISGADVYTQLRKEGWRMPILILTTQEEQVDKGLDPALDEDDFIVKPYSLREVVSRIQAKLKPS